VETLTPALIAEAAQFLKGRILSTPVEASPGLTSALGVPVFLKLECFQLTGSFKIRGAFFALSRLRGRDKSAGVLTCSAGNHGLAVAWAARELGLRAAVCVPSSVDAAKRDAIASLGAEVRVSEFPGFDETQDWAVEQARRESRFFLSAFDDAAVMAGNGGALYQEVRAQVPEARVFILPVGGGGLSAGFSFAAKLADPESVIVGCQHERSPGLKVSLEAGRAITRLPAVDTLAGGLEGGLGAETFEVLRRRVGRVALASEEELFGGVRWMLENHRVLIEPSAAAPVAACLNRRTGDLPGPAVVVLSGRNLSVPALRTIFCG
jgi:threonine dehydratase